MVEPPFALIQYFETSGDPVCFADRKGVIRWANPSLENLSDEVSRGLAGQQLGHFVGAAQVEAMLAVGRDGLATPLRAVWKARSGKSRWLDWRATPVSGGLICCTGRDVTDDVLEIASLAEENARLSSAEEMAQVGHWRLDLRDGTMLWSDEMYRIHGRDPAVFQPTLDGVQEGYHPDDRLRVREGINALVSERRTGVIEARIVRADGTTRIVHIVGRPEVVDGDVVALFGILRDVTRQRHVEADLEETQRSLKSTSGVLAQFLAGTQDRFLALDTKFRIIAFNTAFAEMMRRIVGREIALGDNHADILAEYPDQHSGAVSNFRRALAGKTFSMIREYPTLDGGSITLDLSYGPIRDDDGNIFGLSIIMRDATERLRQEQALRESEARFRALVEGSLQGVLIHTGFTPVFANEAFARIFRFESVDEILAASSVLDFLAEDRRDAARAAHESVLNGEQEAFSARHQERCRDGTMVWVDAILKRTEWDGTPAVQVTIIDVTEQVLYESQLEAERSFFEQQATVDELTGLSNRRHFIAQVEERIRRASVPEMPFALCMFDIDHFKHINDTLGHAAGDEALKAIPSVCEQVLRKSDVIGRIGGEEFAVALPYTSLPEAVAVAERLRDALSTAGIAIDGHPFHMTASFGVAAVVETGDTVDTLLKRADEALYEAKAAGRNRVFVHSGTSDGVMESLPGGGA